MFSARALLTVVSLLSMFTIGSSLRFAMIQTVARLSAIYVTGQSCQCHNPVRDIPAHSHWEHQACHGLRVRLK